MKAGSLIKGAGIAIALAGLTAGIVFEGSAVLSTIVPPAISSRLVPLRDFEQLERYGSVEVTTSDRPPRGLAFLAATEAEREASREDALALAREGIIAVSIDLDAFRKELAQTPDDEDCHYVTDDLKDIAQAVHRALGIRRYFFPVLVGRGEGAAFVYAALAQAPDNTVAGAVSIGFDPVLRSDRPYCFEPALERAGPDRFKLPPEPLPNAWHVIATKADFERIEGFQQTMLKADVVTVEGEASVRRSLVESVLRFGRGGERGTSDLPVAVIKPEGPVTGLAVVISGDGGWRDIDKTVGELLAKDGVAVVGLDALRYFWTRKDPVQVAADVALLLEHYGEEFGTDRFALVGFSFGADIIPDIWPLLPKADRSRVGAVSLLSLGTMADYEITVSGFVGAKSADGKPLGPLLKQLPLDRTQCIYGQEDADENETLCTAPEFDLGERIALDGGHHFNGDYAKVAATIAARLKRRALDEAALVGAVGTP